VHIDRDPPPPTTTTTTAAAAAGPGPGRCPTGSGTGSRTVRTGPTGSTVRCGTVPAVVVGTRLLVGVAVLAAVAAAVAALAVVAVVVAVVVRIIVVAVVAVVAVVVGVVGVVVVVMSSKCSNVGDATDSSGPKTHQLAGSHKGVRILLGLPLRDLMTACSPSARCRPRVRAPVGSVVERYAADLGGDRQRSPASAYRSPGAARPRPRA
jgi:hypothetical protein